MQRLFGLSQSDMQTGTESPFAAFPPGSYHYCLNMFLEATNGFIANNSKRVERTFQLKSIGSAFQFSVSGYSLMLGTEEVDWFADFCRVETIMGDGALPHFIPGEGPIVEKGDFIVCQALNQDAFTKRIALIFQGVHI